MTEWVPKECLEEWRGLGEDGNGDRWGSVVSAPSVFCPPFLKAEKRGKEYKKQIMCLLKMDLTSVAFILKLKTNKLAKNTCTFKKLVPWKYFLMLRILVPLLN